jgi:prepilin-type N-terminal cleavage/methylation domain-containing protein
MIDGMRSGFTLIELLIVVGLVLALMAMTFPLLAWIRGPVEATAVRNLVHAMAMQMSPYAKQRLTGRDGQLHEYFAVGQAAGDTEIDGDPALYAPTHPLATRAPTGYAGFARTVGFSGAVNQLGQPIDRWRRPLHVVYAVRDYLPDGYGVWSTGPKGVGDEINSWTNGEK